MPISSWHDNENTAYQYSASSRRTSVKDSFHLGKENAHLDQSAQNGDPSASLYLTGGLEEHVSDAASPPNVPRFYHGRVRSNTGPRLSRPSVSSRVLPSSQQMTLPQPFPHLEGSITLPRKVSASNGNDGASDTSRRMSVTKGSTQTHNATEVKPTYRMEAFFEPRLSGDSFQGLPGLDHPDTSNHKNGMPKDQNPNEGLLESAPETGSLFRGF